MTIQTFKTINNEKSYFKNKSSFSHLYNIIYVKEES